MWLFGTPRTAPHQASLSITNSQNLLKLISIESMMPSNHLILCCPLLLPPTIFPTSGFFLMSQFYASGGQSIGASASVFSMNIQDWVPLGWTGWISLQSKGLSRFFSNTKGRKAWHAAIHGVGKSWTWLSHWTTVLKAWAPDVASASPGIMLEMQILGSQANPIESKTLGGGAPQSVV